MSRSDAALLVVFDLARDADAAEGRHQHQVAAGNADVGAERRALGADAFLDDLHEHFVAAAKDFLNRRLDARPAAARRPALRPRPPRSGRRDRRPPRSAAAIVRPPRPSCRRPPSVRRRFDRLVVADVDIGHAAAAHRLARIEAALAEILRLDVADVQKAVAADAEIDERRLDARLQVDDPALVDVADVVVLAGPFDVQLFEQSIFNDRDPAFLRLRDVDQHFAFHA